MKNIGGTNQNIGGKDKMVKTGKCMGVSQLLGDMPGLSPKSTPMYVAARPSKNAFHALESLERSNLPLKTHTVQSDTAKDALQSIKTNLFRWVT